MHKFFKLLKTRTIKRHLFQLFHLQHNPISTTNLAPVPRQQQISHLILEQKSANEALQTFKWASKLPNFTHTTSTYRALIHKLCVFKQFDTVKQMLDEMPSSIGAYPDDDIFVTIVRGLCGAKMTREVIGVVELVDQFTKGPPSLKVLNSILDVLVKVDIDAAGEFYRRKMKGNGDDYTYGILMKGLCLTNRIGDAFKLIRAIKTRGVKVNVVMYNTLMHALCKNGKVGRARSLMSEMEEVNGVTFNTLISAYCHEKNLVQALVMLDKCFGYGFVPDVITVTKVVGVLCNAGRVEEAVEVLEQVEAKGGTIDVVAYNTLIKGLVSIGKVRVGCRFFKEMEMKGCLPNTETYKILISGFCESQMLDSALDMFHEMKRVGVKCNFVTYDRLIYGLCSVGRITDGFKILDFMEEDRSVSHGLISPYNSILYGLYKDNRLDEALEYLNNMSNLFPRAVDKSLRILRLCQEGTSEEAKRVYDDMIEKGGFPSALIYASLIQGLCQNGCMREGVELMNKMIGQGYFPVSSTFNKLISGFCQQGKVVRALNLMEEVTSRGCMPDSETYCLVICAFCGKGEVHKALMLCLQMVDRGIVPDYDSWNVLVVGWFEGKKISDVHKLLQRLTHN